MAGSDDHWRSPGFYYSTFPDMRKILLFFWVCLTIFLLNLLLLNLTSILPKFFSSYLNDLLCLPIVLSICLFMIRFFSKDEQIKIPLFSAFSLAAFYSIYFEIYLPDVTERYTSDVVDVLLYFTGALVFWLVQKSEEVQKLND